jgi:glycosyltransferase involved in cell wall biosynthesis
MTQISISYAITVHNEHEELKRLLNQLFSVLGENDEIVIQADQGKVTDEVISVLFPHKRDKRFVYIEYPLNKDFSAFKNNLFKYCTKDYIFNIDADEYLSNELLHGIKSLL